MTDFKVGHRNKGSKKSFLTFYLDIFIYLFYFRGPLNHSKRTIRRSLQKTMDKCLSLILGTKRRTKMNLSRVKRNILTRGTRLFWLNQPFYQKMTIQSILKEIQLYHQIHKKTWATYECTILYGFHDLDFSILNRGSIQFFHFCQLYPFCHMLTWQRNIFFYNMF